MITTKSLTEIAMDSTFIITSPNSRYTEMVRSVSEELKFPCTILEAVLEDATVRTMEYCRNHDVAVIISRGGTASMIREKTNITVLVSGKVGPSSSPLVMTAQCGCGTWRESGAGRACYWPIAKRKTL
jgi:Propionate catabolism activator